MVYDGDAAKIAHHVGVCDGDAHLCLSLLARKLYGVCVGDVVRILEEEPAVADGGVVFLAAEAVCLSARGVTGDVGAERARVVKVVGAVSLGVLVGYEVVRYGLDDILAHL